MNKRQLSSTTYHIEFLMVQTSDHITGATGLTVTVTLSKNAGSFGAASGAVTEIGNGKYKLAANATDRNTLGQLSIHATATGADPTDQEYEIVDYDPFAAPTVTVSASDIRAAIGLATANLDTQLSGIQSDTNDIQTRLPAALTGDGNIKADSLKLNGATPNNLAATAIVSGGAITTSGGKVSEVALLDIIADPGDIISNTDTANLSKMLRMIFNEMMYHTTQDANYRYIRNSAGTIVFKMPVSNTSGTMSKDKLIAP